MRRVCIPLATGGCVGSSFGGMNVAIRGGVTGVKKGMSIGGVRMKASSEYSFIAPAE